ncbi:MAG: hypothetical protein KF683_16255 [Rubrivivax sp.]|nr:hypothetical protein [Rubrivivax sp.]
MAAAAPLACGNCGQAMRVLDLPGHYGQRVEIDLCAPCHLVWFDVVESARLSGPALLALIGAMADAQARGHALPHQPLAANAACPRCRGALRPVHNRTRFGRSLQLECVQRHGAFQTFAQFLAEKGLLRPMSSADRARALQCDGALHCVNCGGDIGQQDSVCGWCGSVPSVVDVARLARALDPEGATAAHAVHATAARQGALQCAACGAAQPPDAGWRCVHCEATLTAPGLAEAQRAVAALAPALHAHAERPSPEVVRRRLEAQSPGLKRQRERAAAMQAEADARMGHVLPPEPDPVEIVQWLAMLREAAGALPGWAAWLAGAALVLLLWWWK